MSRKCSAVSSMVAMRCMATSSSSAPSRSPSFSRCRSNALTRCCTRAISELTAIMRRSILLVQRPSVSPLSSCVSSLRSLYMSVRRRSRSSRAPASSLRNAPCAFRKPRIQPGAHELCRKTRWASSAVLCRLASSGAPLAQARASSSLAAEGRLRLGSRTCFSTATSSGSEPRRGDVEPSSAGTGSTCVHSSSMVAAVSAEDAQSRGWISELRVGALECRFILAGLL
mmetsp:Transcript_22136/g.55543  ORF Transcript_22136/g.55543 Transcript_22136/m.55543 type:complete len:227 (-) Transcript_22136:831-1511(-)